MKLLSKLGEMKSFYFNQYEKKIETSVFVLSTGPFVLGWILGVFYYPVNHRRFLLAVQNCAIFTVIAILFLFLYALHAMAGFSAGILYWIHTLIAAVYLFGNTAILLMEHFQLKSPVYKPLQSLLDKVFLNSTTAL